MKRILKRQTVEMLCERWQMSRDMIYGLAREGDLQLWVELANVRVFGAHLSTASSRHTLLMFRISNEMLNVLSRDQSCGVGGDVFYGHDAEGRPVRVEDIRTEEWRKYLDFFGQTKESINQERADYLDQLESIEPLRGSKLLEVAGPRLVAENGVLEKLGSMAPPRPPPIKIHERELFAHLKDVEAYEEKFIETRGGTSNTATRQEDVEADKDHGIGPTAIPNILNNNLHYFILCGRAWKIRFDGGEECLIPTAQYMKILAEYLKRPGKIIDKSELFNRVCRTGTITDWDSGGAEGLTPQNESQIEKLSSADKKKYEKNFEEVLDQYERAALAGREEQEEAEEDVVKFIAVIGKEYSGALCDRTTSKITWPRKMMERSAATRSAENIPKHIDRAIAAIRKAGQKALADHLTKYLDKKFSVYSPPQDFSSWHVDH